MHAMIMDERSFVASSIELMSIRTPCCIGCKQLRVEKNYYWWCRLLTSFKIEIVTLFMPGRVHVRFNDFVTGFCKLEFAAIYSQQKGAERPNTIFLFRWLSCKLKFPTLLLSCGHWTHRRRLIRCITNHRDDTTYNTFKQRMVHARVTK